MSKKLLTYLILGLTVLAASTVAAEDFETLNVYKLTSYNLGTLLNSQESGGMDLYNFEPLLITSTKADILTGLNPSPDHLSTTPDPNNVMGFAIAAEYSASPQLAVQGVFGMAKSNLDINSGDSYSSWEANLGVVYRLLDNLSYEVHFGYMETGDLFKERSSYSDSESIIMVSNKLTMSF